MVTKMQATDPDELGAFRETCAMHDAAQLEAMLHTGSYSEAEMQIIRAEFARKEREERTLASDESAGLREGEVADSERAADSAAEANLIAKAANRRSTLAIVIAVGGLLVASANAVIDYLSK